MRRSALGRVAGPLIYAAVLTGIGAFAYSGVKGERGLGAQAAAKAETAALGQRLTDLRAERKVAENRVRRLTREYLDLDLLDEEARAILGLVRPDEVVIRPVAR